MNNKALLFWSSGKDSALALHRSQTRYEIISLVTTVNRPEYQVAVHRVPEQLLNEQARSCGLPICKLIIPQPCSNEIYERIIIDSLCDWKEKGVSYVIFGDLFLKDIKDYRETLLDRAGLRGVFPLWQNDTTKLANEIISLGFKALIVCVDKQVLNTNQVGREYDRNFIQSLPKDTDPCGENGEFHTFVYDAPYFKRAISFVSEGVIEDDRFCYSNLTE